MLCFVHFIGEMYESEQMDFKNCYYGQETRKERKKETFFFACENSFANINQKRLVVTLNFIQ